MTQDSNDVLQQFQWPNSKAITSNSHTLTTVDIFLPFSEVLSKLLQAALDFSVPETS